MLRGVRRVRTYIVRSLVKEHRFLFSITLGSSPQYRARTCVPVRTVAIFGDQMVRGFAKRCRSVAEPARECHRQHAIHVCRVRNFRIADHTDVTHRTRYHSMVMLNLRVQIVRFVAEDQPGIVECQFHDAQGRLHSIVDKASIFTPAALWSDSEYPCPGAVRCQVLANVAMNRTVRIRLAEPDHVEATDGSFEFVVAEAELTP